MAGPRTTLGHYLGEPEPLVALWSDMVALVYRDDPRRADLDRLGSSARTLYCTGVFLGELINGGVSQFLSNSSGNHAHETLEALRRIDSGAGVALLEQALTLFPGGAAPTDRRQRCDLLFAFEERDPRFLEDLSSHFLRDEATTLADFNARELAFLRTHQGDRVER